MTYQKSNITPYHEHTGRALAERDTLSGLMDRLEGVLSRDAPRPLSPEEELQAIMGTRFKEPERTLSEREAAQWVGLTPTSLAGRRRRGTGPAVHESWNGQPRYTPQALHDWQTERRCI